MRILSLVFSFLVTVSLATVALIYLERRVGQHRIYVQDEWLSSPDQKAYRSYGASENTSPDTAQIVLGDSLPPALLR
jgi:hypothetical protein